MRRDTPRLQLGARPYSNGRNWTPFANLVSGTWKIVEKPSLIRTASLLRGVAALGALSRAVASLAWRPRRHLPARPRSGRGWSADLAGCGKNSASFGAPPTTATLVGNAALVLDILTSWTGISRGRSGANMPPCQFTPGASRSPIFRLGARTYAQRETCVLG